MILEVEINDEIVTQLSAKFDYKEMITDENDQPIQNPMSRQDFIKQVLIKQVVDLLLEDRIKEEVDTFVRGVKPLVENAIKQQVIVR